MGTAGFGSRLALAWLAEVRRTVIRSAGLLGPCRNLGYFASEYNCFSSPAAGHRIATCSCRKCCAFVISMLSLALYQVCCTPRKVSSHLYT